MYLTLHSTYFFQLHRAKDADVAAKVPVIAMPPHMPAEIDLGRSVGTADGAAHPGLRCGAPRMRPQMSLERLLDRARVRAQRAPILLSLVSRCIAKRKMI